MTTKDPAGLREAADALVNALQDRPATNLTRKQWYMVEALRAALLADPVPLDVEAWMESERLRQIKDHEARGGWSDGFRAGVHALAARLRENTEAGER